VAKSFEQERTGHRPKSVTVVLSDDALVITLHGALSEAEKALAKDPNGAAKVQEFHQEPRGNREVAERDAERAERGRLLDRSGRAMATPDMLRSPRYTGVMGEPVLLVTTVPHSRWLP